MKTRICSGYGNARVVTIVTQTDAALITVSGSKVFISSLVRPDTTRVQEQGESDVKYDLLINSYMNSGSRFTGSLFGFR